MIPVEMKPTVALLLFAHCVAVGALICRHCTDPNDPECSQEEDLVCPWGSMCLSAAAFVESDYFSGPRIFKDCVRRSLCPSPGQYLISSNVLGSYALANATCCNSHKCNSNNMSVPEKSARKPNRRFCPACDSDDPECLAEVECRGDEDTCFSAKLLKLGMETKVYGCSSPKVCDVSYKLKSLPFLEKLGTVIDTPECYEAPPPEVRSCFVCLNDDDPTCSSTEARDCKSNEDQCFTSTSLDGRVRKGCAPDTLCYAAGNAELSVDSGSMSQSANFSCCRGNGCNSDTLEVPAVQELNNILCNFCFTGTTSCIFLVQCQGNELRCFRTFGNVSGIPQPIMGCASLSVCNAPSSIDILLSDTTLTEPLSCCETSQCDDPELTSTLAPTTNVILTEDPILLTLPPGLNLQPQMLFLIQQLLLYLQQLQLLMLQCPNEPLMLTLQPLLLLCQQVLVYMELMLTG